MKQGKLLRDFITTAFPDTVPEAIALRLGVSVATYYRYLNRDTSGLFELDIGILQKFGVITRITDTEGNEVSLDSKFPHNVNVPALVRAGHNLTQPTLYRVLKKTVGKVDLKSCLGIFFQCGYRVEFCEMMMQDAEFVEMARKLSLQDNGLMQIERIEAKAEQTEIPILLRKHIEMAFPSYSIQKIAIDTGVNIVSLYRYLGKSDDYLFELDIGILKKLGVITRITDTEGNEVSLDSRFPNYINATALFRAGHHLSKANLYVVLGKTIGGGDLKSCLGIFFQCGYRVEFCETMTQDAEFVEMARKFSLQDNGLMQIEPTAQLQEVPNVISTMLLEIISERLGCNASAANLKYGGFSQATFYQKLKDDRQFTYYELKNTLRVNDIDEVNKELLIKYHRSLFRLDEAQTPEAFLARLMQYHNVSKTYVGIHQIRVMLSEYGSGIKTEEMLQNILTKVLGSDDDRDASVKADAAKALELFRKKGQAAKKWELVDEAQSVRLLLSRLIAYHNAHQLLDKPECQKRLSEVNSELPDRAWVQDLLEKIDAAPADRKLVWEMYELESQRAVHVELSELLRGCNVQMGSRYWQNRQNNVAAEDQILLAR